MRYYLDTEFHEYKKKPLIGKPIDTIELISIGIVSEDDREYYAISKDFDLKAAWKNDWLRKNVLESIYYELVLRLYDETGRDFFNGAMKRYKIMKTSFSYKTLRKLIKRYGKSNIEIAKEIVRFTGGTYNELQGRILNWETYTDPKFYAYFADYDWVVFCWLFGRMIDLPKGFPKYCLDLKQMLDERANSITNSVIKEWHNVPKNANIKEPSFDEKLQFLKCMPKYPRQDNEHDALADAKWNKKLYEFIKSL